MGHMHMHAYYYSFWAHATPPTLGFTTIICNYKVDYAHHQLQFIYTRSPARDQFKDVEKIMLNYKYDNMTV